jgi:rhodanese-related sulfurtransferase
VGTLNDLQEEVTPEQAAELLRSGEVQLLDVREPYEHEAGRIEGARRVDLEGLAQEAPRLDQSKPVVFYCRSGGRSAVATQAFRAAGFQAFNVSGGLLAWQRSGLPMEPDGAEVADH